MVWAASWLSACRIRICSLVTTADTQPLAGGVQTILDAFWNCLLPGVADAALPANPAAYAELTKKLSTMQLPIVENLAAPDTELCCATVQMGLNAPGLTALQLQEKRTGAALRRQDLHAAFPDGGIGAKPSVGRPALPCVIAMRLACSGLPPFPGASAGRATRQPEFAAKAAPRRCDPGSVQP